MRSQWKTFLRLPRRERGILLEAVFLTGLARLAILTVSFKRLAPFLGRPGEETPRETEPVSLETARAVGRMVRAISRHTPWESKCLVQAATAQMMLGRRGISSTLYLGLAKNDEEKMIAHAWLRCGALIVTGGTGLAKYAVVGQFSRRGKANHKDQ